MKWITILLTVLMDKTSCLYKRYQDNWSVHISVRRDLNIFRGKWYFYIYGVCYFYQVVSLMDLLFQSNS